MKKRTSLALILTLISAAALFSFASAQETAVAKSTKAGESQGNSKNVVVADETVQVSEESMIQEDGKKGKKENKGQVNAQSHRSAVATFVQSLLAISGREGGIGQQVKVIAQEQNESKEKVAESIDQVEKRGKIKTFLFGSDYKNLGELRSEMVKTRNQIEQLKRLAEKAQNEGDKAELQKQIQAMEQEQANIDNFIAQNESQFSLFGWAVKLFQ